MMTTSEIPTVIPSISAAQPAPSPSPTSTSSADSSAAASEDDSSSRPRPHRLSSRPRIGSRKASGSMIVENATASTTVVDEEMEEGDVRTMSPRRSSDEVDKLGEEARQDLIEQAKTLQASLQAIVDRVESVKSEHEKLEGGNKFLQSCVAPGLLICLFANMSRADTSANSCKHRKSLRKAPRARKGRAEVRNEMKRSKHQTTSRPYNSSIRHCRLASSAFGRTTA